MEVSQFVVVQPEKAKNGAMKILEGMSDFDGLLDEPSRQQTTAAKGVGFFFSYTVECAGFGGFFIEIDKARDFALHAKGQLVGLDAGREIFVAWILLLMQAIQLGH